MSALRQPSRKPGGQKCFSQDIQEEQPVKVLYSPLLTKRLFFSPSSNPFHLPHREVTSGKFKQECKLRDVYRKTEIDCIKWQPVIAWKEINSNLSTESKAASVYICPCMSCWDQELAFSGL